MLFKDEDWQAEWNSFFPTVFHNNACSCIYLVKQSNHPRSCSQFRQYKLHRIYLQIIAVANPGGSVFFYW